MSGTEVNAAAERAEYVKNNRDKFAHYAARQRDKLKLEVVAAYGGKCEHCNENDPVVLSIDHIHDDAHIEKAIFGNSGRGGSKLYARLKAEGWPKERFQLLCYNCNAKKEHARRRATITESWGEEKFAQRDLVQARIGKQRNNKSGFKGVFWNTQKSRWTARIMLNYTNEHLGMFVNIADAARAYKKAAIAAWGTEANVPTEEEINEIAAKTINPIVPSVVEVNINLEDIGL